MPKCGAMASTMPLASSVIMTKPIRALSSSSSKRDPAASLTQATFSRVRSGDVGRRLGPAGALAQVDVDADDVGMPCGEGEHPLAATADDQRWSGPLDRTGEQRVPVHLVVGAVEREGAVGAQQPLMTCTASSKRSTRTLGVS